MKFKVLGKELAKKLPGVVPKEEVVLEGTPVLLEKEEQELRERHARVHAALNPIEWKMFKTMLQFTKGAPISALVTCLSQPAKSNAVQVHIGLLRKKFEAYALPFRIVTKRKIPNEEGQYRLVNKP